MTDRQMTDRQMIDCPECEGDGLAWCQHKNCGNADHAGTCPRCNGVGEVDAPGWACGSCGEREDSVYAKPCCTSDSMVEL